MATHIKAGRGLNSTAATIVNAARRASLSSPMAYSRVSSPVQGDFTIVEPVNLPPKKTKRMPLPLSSKDNKKNKNKIVKYYVKFNKDTECFSIDPESERPLNIRWECDLKNRYYEARLDVDLFGDWVLTRAWGRRGSALGNSTNHPHSSYYDAITEVSNIVKRRKQHKYEIRKVIF